MRAAGIHVVESPALLGETVERVLGKKKAGAAAKRTRPARTKRKASGTRRKPSTKKKR